MLQSKMEEFKLLSFKMEVRTEVAFLWSENVIFLCNSLCCVLYFL